MDNRKKLNSLFKILSEVDAYGRCIGKVSYDMECTAPEEGIQQAGEDMSLIGKHIHKLTHSAKYISLISELHEDSEGLTEIEKKTVEHLYDSYSKTKNISSALAYKISLNQNKAYGDWLKAKKENNYGLFKKTFAKNIEFTRKAIDLRDRKYDSYYAACLDDYEKGGTQQQLDAFFARIKERTVPLIKRIVEEGKPIREDFITRPVAIPLQEQCSEYLLETEKLRKTALVLGTTEHPFTTEFGPHDVRVTTHYHENNFFSNIYSVMHEGGHALFMQNEPEEMYKSYCANSMTSAMHETISRFYENIVGRSEEFITYIYPKLKELVGDALNDVSARELFEAANIARPSLIRTEADELTYCIHIMIRYELEKAFVNGEISVDEIPALWNAKYKEYLGIDVPNDTEGCLQDVHWTMDYGYFPSYALGNAYGVQILRTMEKEFDVFKAIGEGRLEVILEWLTKNVFSIASVTTPDEWIKAITGQSLNVDYYLDYLEDKFTKLYCLK